MKCIRFIDLQDIGDYDFNDVIQCNCCTGTQYLINQNRIIIAKPRKSFCLYNATELLEQICNAGKYFAKLGIKITLDFEFNNYYSGLPFGIREDKFQIYYTDEQIKQALEYIKQWCIDIAPPCCCVEDNTLEANNIIEFEAIEDFIGKSIVIYLVKTTYNSIFYIQKILYTSNLENEYNVDVISKINKGIENLNLACPILFKYYRQILTLGLEYENQDIYDMLDYLNFLVGQLCNFTMNCYNKFSNSLTATAIYNFERKEYVKLFISDNIANLAWNHLISIITSESPIQAQNVCRICGTPLELDVVKTGPKPTLCNKHYKEQNQTSNRDRERHYLKQKLKSMLKFNEVTEKDKAIINELVQLSDRRFLKRKGTDLLKKYNQL